jgi:hypothetical protein
MSATRKLDQIGRPPKWYRGFSAVVCFSNDGVISHEVRNWLLMAKSRVVSRVIPCDFRGGRNSIGAGFTYFTTNAPYSSITPPEVCDSSDHAAHYHILGIKFGTSSMTLNVAGYRIRK